MERDVGVSFAGSALLMREERGETRQKPMFGKRANPFERSRDFICLVVVSVSTCLVMHMFDGD